MSDSLRLSRLTVKGVERFSTWIADLKLDPKTADPVELLVDSDLVEQHESGLVIHPKKCETRYEFGLDLYRQLRHLPMEIAYDDRRMWTWMAFVFRDLLLPQTKSGRKCPGEDARYIPSLEWNRRYRHLVRGPWHLISLHADDPSCTEVLLANPVHTPGELYEQLASRLDLVASRGVMMALRGLYFDQSQRRPKRGALGKNAPGTTRRFGKLIQQLILTYHVPGADGPALTQRLPAREFGRFADAAGEDVPA